MTPGELQPVSPPAVPPSLSFFFPGKKRFKRFPDVLYEIVSLETVLLGNNQVGVLDAERLKALAALSTLDLSNNDLLNVAPQLGLCTSLR